MKIDIENKIVEVNNAVELTEIIKTLKKILPGNEWKKCKVKPSIFTDECWWENPSATIISDNSGEFLYK